MEEFYDVFRDVVESVHSSTDVGEVMDLVVWKFTDILDAKGTLLRILNLRTDEVELGSAYGLSERYLAKGPLIGKSTIVDIHDLNKAVVSDDLRADSHVQHPREAFEEGIRMLLDLPIGLRENVIGVIRVFFAEKRTFTKKEMDFMLAVAAQCACAIERARLFEEERSRYDQLALQTEKLSALGRMAAGIAHEINNPLAGILLYSTNLRKKYPDELIIGEALGIVIQETIRCRRIIQDLLEFSRQRDSMKVEANLNEVIEKALSLLENELHLHHITVEKDLTSQVPNHLLDVSQMQQVFVNLLLNAIEATQPNGRIAIFSHTDPGFKSIIVEVSDTGCGIPAENIPRIFEPFFSTKPKGTGLGLAVSYGIIQNHRGDFQVHSQPGEGTRFVVTIPIVYSGS